jgi:hypothetical protein
MSASMNTTTTEPNTRRTARGNRIGLGLLGLILLVTGGAILIRSTGLFGGILGSAGAPVYSDETVAWVHDQRPWFWLTIAAVGVLVALLALRWLLVQLRSDRLGRLMVDTDHAGVPASGRADVPAGAVTTAVGQEVDAYRGVQKVRVALTGRPDRPELRLTVTADPDTDLSRLRRRITGEALAHVRSALDTDRLTTHLHLIVGRRARVKGNRILTEIANDPSVQVPVRS